MKPEAKEEEEETMKRFTVILTLAAALVLLTTPALAVEDATPGKTRKAAPMYALSHDVKHISVPFDVAIVRPLALIGGTVRLGFVALFQSQSLRHETDSLVQYVFVDPIGQHRR